jgi:tetratricopeptide (TPR) repeat protein
LNDDRTASADADHELAELDKALAAYESVIRTLRNEPETDYGPWLLATTYFMQGQAYQERAAVSVDRRTKAEYLGHAKDAYEESRRHYASIGADEEPWPLHNNLGVVYYSHAGSGAMALQQADSEYSDGLRLLGQIPDSTEPPGHCSEKSPDTSMSDEQLEGVALLSMNRGTARAEYSRLLQSQNQPGEYQLECAKSDFLNALAFLNARASGDRDKEPNCKARQARAQSNLANILGELGNLDQAIVNYREALENLEKGSLDYARVQKSLAETYFDQGEQSLKAGSLILALSSYQNALGSYDDAIRVLRTKSASEELADALQYRAKSRTAMCVLDHCGPNCLSDVLSDFGESEQLFLSAGMSDDAGKAHRERDYAQKKCGIAHQANQHH